MQPVIDALNAPMFEGLETALGDLTGETYNREDFVGTAELAMLVKLYEDVDFGFVIPDDYALRRIRFYLGTSAFNVWVAGYNGQ